MENFFALSDSALVESGVAIAGEERALTSKMLRHLQEVDRRRLYSELGHSSLMEYAMKRLLYSEDQAVRRIQAMRLLKEIPEIETKINSGSLTLTNLGMAQSLFSRERRAGNPVCRAEKMEIISELEGVSSREAQRKLAAISPVSVTDRVRPVSGDEYEIRFGAPKGFLDKVETLKGMLAHSEGHVSMLQLFDKLCDLGLKEFDRGKSPAAPRVKSQAEIRRAVWKRDGGRCTQCSGTFALELDHIVPKAKGGPSSYENLRLLCRSCNQRAAVRHFGVEKMAQHIDPQRSG